MKSKFHKEIICFGNTKRAAIFFDRVMPIGVDFVDERGIVPHEMMNLVGELVFGEDYPPGTVKIPRAYGYAWTGYFHSISKKILESQTADIVAYKQMITAKDPNWLSRLYIDNVPIPDISPDLKGDPMEGGLFRDMIIEFSRKIGRFRNPAISLPSDAMLISKNRGDVLLTISGLELVDTKCISWEQIFSIRRNPDARRKLRNFRLFAFENYKDKSRAYIEDDIAKRVEDYQVTCREHAIETRQSCLSILLKAENLRLMGIAGLASLVLGEPIAASAAIVSGTCLDLGGIALEFSKRRLSLNKIKRDHDVAYIDEVTQIIS